MTSLPNLPITEISKPTKTFRLVTKDKVNLSRYIHEKDELLVAEQLADLVYQPSTHKQLHKILSYTSDITPEEIINDTFTNSRGNSRFNDKTQQVWYCAFEHDTAVEEKIYHLESIQKNTKEYGNVFLCQEVFAYFTGKFHDARGEPRGKGILGPDPNEAYPLGQELAHKLRAEKSCGIIYPSVRDPEEKGTCLVAFRQKIVKDVQLGNLWEMSWNKEGKFNGIKMV